MLLQTFYKRCSQAVSYTHMVTECQFFSPQYEVVLRSNVPGNTCCYRLMQCLSFCFSFQCSVTRLDSPGDRSRARSCHQNGTHNYLSNLLRLNFTCWKSRRVVRLADGMETQSDEINACSHVTDFQLTLHDISLATSQHTHYHTALHCCRHFHTDAVSLTKQ